MTQLVALAVASPSLPTPRSRRQGTPCVRACYAACCAQPHKVSRCATPYNAMAESTLCSVAGHSSPRNPTIPPPRVPPNRALLSFFKDFSSTRGKGKGKPGTRLKSDRRFCVLLISSWLGERGGERACCCTFSSNEGVIK